jgi:hypothetical protein
MSAGPSYSKVAGGNISPSSFVKLDSSNSGQVLQCGSNDVPYGIAQPGTNSPPFSTLDSVYAAVITENLLVYGPGAKDVLLQISAACNPGQHLKSDTNGFGTPITASTDNYGAVAQEKGVANQIIRVQVVYAGIGFGSGV